MSIVRTQPIVSEAQIRTLVSEGHTAVKIAEMLGVNLGMLRGAMSLLGIKSQRHIHCRAKESLELLLTGLTLQEIGDLRGISKQLIYIELRRAKLPTTIRKAIRAQLAASSTADQG